MAPDWLAAASLTTLAASVASGTGLLLSQKLRHRLLPVEADTFLKDQLPFDSVESDQITLRSKNGGLSRVIELQGINSDCLTREITRNLFHKRMHWLQFVAEQGLGIRLMTIRDELQQALPACYREPVLQEMHERWMQQFARSYQNRHYLVLSEHPREQDWMATLKGHITSEKPPDSIHAGRLNTATEAVMDLLHDYHPQLLRNDTAGASPLLSFWATLIHGRQTTVGAFTRHLSDYLTGCELRFDGEKKQMIWQQGEHIQYGAILSLNAWGDQADSQLMQELNSLKGRFMLLQHLKGWPKAKALLHLEDQKKQRNLLGDLLPNDKVVEEFEAASRLVGNDESALFTYQCSVLLLSESKPELQTLLSQASRIFRNYGFTPIQEGGCMEYIWKSFMPHTVIPNRKKPYHAETFLRPSHPLSHNLAYWLNFPREASGLSRSDWGEGPVRLFKTASGGAYSLQLHESSDKEALAHALVIAPAGSGKTTLFQHLLGGALRHNQVKGFIFDRFKGTKIFTESIGGSYIDFSGEGEPVALNPFVCEDTAIERGFLTRFLGNLAGLFDPASRTECRRAVDLVLGVPRSQRVLSHLYPNLFQAQSPLKQALQPWVGRGENAHWFNGMQGGQAFDALNLEESRLVSFDLTTVLDHKDQTAALMHYLLHRIRGKILKNASPHMIFIDEAAPILQSDLVQVIAVWLREQRKLRGSISLCFQDTGDLVKSSIASIILKQCTTRFLFPNASASREEYSVFNLTDAEMAYIKGETRLSRTLQRSVLVKKSPANGQNESVILNLDMSPLGPYLKLYRSGAEPVRLVQELQQQWGQSAWLDPYLNAA